MELLEREAQLARLQALHARAAAGHGACILIHGEAGIGKTALVRQFLSSLDTLETAAGVTTRKLVAGCEALFTPRPLGPLVDLADGFPPAVAQALHDGRSCNGLFPGILGHLKSRYPSTVLVIEDLHWADEGTLDFVRYAGRRIGAIPALLVLTYRDDELGADHPLRTVLGDLPSADTARLGLGPLSLEAVEQLAQTLGRAAKGLHHVTGGNPFFVTEVLQGACTSHDELPASVRDAVLARLSRVSAAARAVAEWTCVSPKQLERAIVEALVPDAAASIDECLAAGILQSHDACLAFRHDLARQAVEQSLLPLRRIALHRCLFDALSTPPSDAPSAALAPRSSLARRVHHAEHGELAAHVITLAPQAAREAVRASAHREAAAHYALALDHAHDADAATRADWLEALAGEQHLLGQVQAALDATRRALALRRDLGDRRGEAGNLRVLADATWRNLGDRAAAESAINQALDVLEPLDPGCEHVHAWCTKASLHASWSEYEQGLASAHHALALAESLGDPHALIEALHARASARLCMSDDVQARAQLERALALAIEQRLDGVAGRLFTALQTLVMNHRDYAYALDVAERGQAYCEAHDLDAHLLHVHDRRATTFAELGRWQEADRELAVCMASPAISTRLRDSVVFLQARLDMRRGCAGAAAYWLDAQRAPQDLRVGFRLPAVAAACAEAAWLRGDAASFERSARVGVDAALRCRDARLAGPALVWLHRAGARAPMHTLAIASQHACELAGDIDGAAREWQRLGCTYERALALLHGDADQVRDGLAIFDAIGAVPAARLARERLRSMGVRGAPRGPQARTRVDPLGLTSRERQIYELLMQGLGNAAIAGKLHRSQRTVEHHVASVLAKANATSRVELLAKVVRSPHALAAANDAGLRRVSASRA